MPDGVWTSTPDGWRESPHGRNHTAQLPEEDVRNDYQVRAIAVCPGILCMLVKDPIRLDIFYRLFFSSLPLLFDNRESLDAVVRDGEAITQRIKKAVANNDFLAIMSVFQVS